MQERWPVTAGDVAQDNAERTFGPRNSGARNNRALRKFLAIVDAGPANARTALIAP
jgi:hypothetical protein